MTDTKLSIGTEVPEVAIPDQNGNPVSLSDFKGKKVILFFYPQDNTPTCTTEACNLRDHYAELAEKGYVVIGVSPDSQKKHQNFIKKFDLPYTLLSDPDRLLIEAFGVWGEKTSFGKTYMGLIRTTFIIDEAGKVAHVIDKVVAKEHTQQILEIMEG